MWCWESKISYETDLAPEKIHPYVIHRNNVSGFQVVALKKATFYFSKKRVVCKFVKSWLMGIVQQNLGYAVIFSTFDIQHLVFASVLFFFVKRRVFFSNQEKNSLSKKTDKNDRLQYNHKEKSLHFYIKYISSRQLSGNYYGSTNYKWCWNQHKNIANHFGS